MEVFNRLLPLPSLSVITAVGRFDETLVEAGRTVELLAKELPLDVQWVLSLDGNVTEEWVREKTQHLELTTLILPSDGMCQGPAVVRNRALAAASGEVIATLDSDDRFKPLPMAQLYLMLVSSPVLWVAGMTQEISSDGRPLAYQESTLNRGMVMTDAYINGATNTGWPFHPCAALTYKKIMVEFGGWEEAEPFATRGQDTALWARINHKYLGLWSGTGVHDYRTHENSRTSAMGKSNVKNSLAERIEILKNEFNLPRA